MFGDLGGEIGVSLNSQGRAGFNWDKRGGFSDQGRYDFQHLRAKDIFIGS